MNKIIESTRRDDAGISSSLRQQEQVRRVEFVGYGPWLLTWFWRQRHCSDASLFREPRLNSEVTYFLGLEITQKSKSLLGHTSTSISEVETHCFHTSILRVAYWSSDSVMTVKHDCWIDAISRSLRVIFDFKPNKLGAWLSIIRRFGVHAGARCRFE